MSTDFYDFDFAVAGGGPAGASAAISLRQRGCSVVVLERESFPRFHIGESLLSTANDAFGALGVRDQIEAAGFPQKWGAHLSTHDGQSTRYVDFTQAREIARPQTFQVCRQEFDRILLNRSKEMGAEVRENCRVTDCDFSPDSAILSVSSGPGSVMSRIRTRAIVDATGRAGLIARKFNLRVKEPRLANLAIYSHYTNVPKLEGARPDDLRLIARSDAGWFWMIPVSSDLTSVGLVLTKQLYQKLAADCPEETFQRAIAETPVVAQLMRAASRALPVRVESDFSYSASAYAGNRWILAGDAGSFLDPVFSTGVSIALESGMEAAAELHLALEKGDFSAQNFSAFSHRQHKRYRTFRRFVLAFYTPQFRDLFFSSQPPPLLFGPVVTVLAGRWNAGLRTRFLNHLLFMSVLLQKYFTVTSRIFSRESAAGYPD